MRPHRFLQRVPRDAGRIAPDTRTPRPLPSLSAFLPAHDEEANILTAAEALLRMLPRVARRWELVIVNDGSRDRTGMVAEALARRHPGAVRVIHHARNRGYGAALRSGFAAARFDYVFFTDADRQFDPAGLPALLGPLANADAVVGWRRERADPAHRRVLSACWNWLVCRLFGLQLHDVNCAFKVLRRRALEGITLEADGAVVSAELMARVAHGGHRVVEIPVAHFPRRAGAASGGRLDVIARAVVELVRLRRRLREERRVAVRAREAGARLEALG